MSNTVCVVTENHTSAVMGGAQYQSHILSNELAKAGAEVVYLAKRVDNTRTGGLNYQVQAISDAADAQRRILYRDQADLRAALGRIQPDVVYQTMRQSYTYVCAQYAKANQVPFVFHCASDMDIETGLFPDQRITRAFPVLCLEHTLGLRGMKGATHHIAQNQKQADVLLSAFGLSSDLVVPPFQELKENMPEKPNGPMRVLWLANLKDVKRPELFIELAKDFVHRDDIQFLMAGRAPESQRHIDALAEGERLPNFSYLGELDRDGVQREMEQAAIHVNTSFVEGFPNTFIEAWSNGAVVMTLGVDPVDQGMNARGVGFSASSMTELCDQISKFADNESQRLAIACQAHKYVWASHSIAWGEKLAQLVVNTAHTRHKNQA